LGKRTPELELAEREGEMMVARDGIEPPTIAIGVVIGILIYKLIAFYCDGRVAALRPGSIGLFLLAAGMMRCPLLLGPATKGWERQMHELIAECLRSDWSALADDLRTLAAHDMPEVPALAQFSLCGISLNGVSTHP
jgi:hypothetical protein